MSVGHIVSRLERYEPVSSMPIRRISVGMGGNNNILCIKNKFGYACMESVEDRYFSFLLFWKPLFNQFNNIINYGLFLCLLYQIRGLCGRRRASFFHFRLAIKKRTQCLFESYKCSPKVFYV